LLGRGGARVALAEARPDLASYKTICTHFIQPSATPTIERLGLADRIEAAGGVRNRVELWTRFGWIRPQLRDDYPHPCHGYNIRREKLDPMVRELAVEAPGVELLIGETATAMLGASGRPTGVRIVNRERREREISTRPRIDGLATLVSSVGDPDSAEAVVFVHGNPGSRRDWDDLLTRVAPFARAVALDMPGFGRAERPRHFSYTVEGYAHFLGSALDHLAIERAHLVLHDFGGPWGLEWAIANPDRFASAVLINTGALVDYRWHHLAKIWRTPVPGDRRSGGRRAQTRRCARAARPTRACRLGRARSVYPGGAGEPAA
jgi:alpha/beta hydrolase fold